MRNLVGPAIHAENDMFQRETTVPQNTFVMLGWSPWGHHFVINAFDSKNEAFEFVGDVSYNYYSFLKSESINFKTDGRIFLSDENRAESYQLESERKDFFASK